MTGKDHDKNQQWLYLQHSSCTYGLGKTVEEGYRDSKSQRTRESAVRLCLLEVIVATSMMLQKYDCLNKT